MDNFLTNDTKVIILLCGVLGNDCSVKPLTPSEYNSLARWLVKECLRPESLLELSDYTSAALGSGIDKERLSKLLDRGVQLGFSIEEWQRSGLWIISRSDPEYPARYKSHLREKAPPLLFGAGDKSLLQGGGLAIVGSRNVDHEGGDFTRKIAEDCAQNGMPVVSGAARGVDQIAMRSALEAGGKAIGVMADNLLKASIERHARYAIAEGQLLLLSPYHPKARFTVGSAMGRNKLIYAMADYALVVSADYKKGGTWNGAEEELKRDNSIAVFVRTGRNVSSGNTKLLEIGAQAWPVDINDDGLSSQLSELAGNRQKLPVPEPETLSLFDYKAPVISVAQPPLQEKLTEQSRSKSQLVDSGSEAHPETIYEAILPILLSHLDQPMTVDDLTSIVDIAKGQLNVWLKKAVADGVVKKDKNPVRYSAKCM